MKDLSKEYEECVKDIEQLRLLSWSSVDDYDVCGIVLNPLTIRAWIDLRLSGNELFLTGEPSLKSICAYLWRNSKHYSLKKSLKSSWNYWIIERKARKANIIELVKGVEQHIADAFSEAPHEVGGNGYHRTSGPSKVAGITCIADEIGHRYGMNPDDVMDMPMVKVYQLKKVIGLSTIEGYKVADPERLRNINSEILKSLNNG